MAKPQSVSVTGLDGENEIFVDSDGDGHIKSKIWDGADEVTVTNNRLDTNAKQVIIPDSDRVQEYQTFSTINNKINYTVPAGKKLYITHMSISLSDVLTSTMVFEWQEDGTGFLGMQLDNTSNTYCSDTTDKVTAWGSFSAGTVIRCSRIDGDNDSWSATMKGFLEDE